MIRVAIGGKSKALLTHLSGNPPNQKDEKYEQWEQDDLVVFSWLIQNIEPSLASNLTEFPTARTLWDALVVTYSSGKDKLQTFDLHVKANEFKQNGLPLEDFWIVLQGIWGEIDRRDPNPMKCADDITAYNTIRAEQKLFQFLNALDQKFDPIKREILRRDSLPTAEAAYAAVRKETTHQNILRTGSSPSQGIAAGLITIEAEGAGYATQRRPIVKSSGTPTRVDKSKLKCTHCGMIKHTKEQCFRLVGYPEWWDDGHKKGKKDEGEASAPVGNLKATGSNAHNRTGAVMTVAADFVEQDTGNIGKVNMAINNGSWIFDCGATDTMTYDPSDICVDSKPRRTHIQTANGEVMPVKGGGTIELSPILRLPNCLYIPSLSHKLLSISHVTKELNCTLLMHPTFCILQDIRTGMIIGRGTERQGLYYVDDVTQQGTVKLAHGTTDREAWLWHRRLGHPSSGYLHYLFPKLFRSNKSLDCETCVLAKSHRHTFKPNNTRVDHPFDLIHSDVWGPAPVNGGHNFR